MKKYQVITITSKRILVENFNDTEMAYSYFKVAKFGYPEDEKVEKIYLTKDNKIITEQYFK